MLVSKVVKLKNTSRTRLIDAATVLSNEITIYVTCHRTFTRRRHVRHQGAISQSVDLGEIIVTSIFCEIFCRPCYCSSFVFYSLHLI